MRATCLTWRARQGVAPWIATPGNAQRRRAAWWLVGTCYRSSPCGVVVRRARYAPASCMCVRPQHSDYLMCATLMLSVSFTPLSYHRSNRSSRVIPFTHIRARSIDSASIGTSEVIVRLTRIVKVFIVISLWCVVRRARRAPASVVVCGYTGSTLKVVTFMALFF